MTEADVFTGLSGLEKTGFANAAAEGGDSNPLAAIIIQVVHYAHGFIGDCRKNSLPEDDLIPERMIFPLIALVRHRYASAIGYEMSETRIDEAEKAERFLEKVAACKVSIEPLPNTATQADEVSGEQMEVVSDSSGRLTDKTLNGL